MAKKLFKIIYFSFIFICISGVSIFSKSIDTNIKGKVIDETTGEALVGCTVLEKGTKNGVNTDANGAFSISARNADAVLVIGYIGYLSQEIRVGNQSNIVVKLSPNAQELNEVLVIGYGITSSKDVTGSAKSIKSKDFNTGIITSPEQLLQGKVSGVNITSASGEPGSPLNISVRGPGGIRSGSTPLFVLDGFALDNSGTGGAVNPLTFLNPEDIEAIDVLKDASATAIYGARGANGVILITTKKGKSGTSKLSYTTNFGVSQIARPIDVFTADEFRSELTKLNIPFVDDKGNTDWQKEITRQAFTQNHNLTLSGGNEKLKYFGSFGLQKQEGIMKGSNLDRYNGRINLNQNFWENRLSVDANFSASNTKNVRAPFQSMIGSALTANPTYSARGTDGKLKVYPDGTNPLLTLELDQDYNNNFRILGNISPSLTIFKGLVYKLNYGVDYSNNSRDFQSKPNKEPLREGRLDTYNTFNTNKLIENYLTYSFTNKIFGLSVLGGHSYQKIFLQGRNYSINKFPINGIEPRYNPGFGQDLTYINNAPDGYAVVNELQSYFSRANFEYKDKYLATATVRADGSSKFGSNNKYGIFPSFSLGWRLSEESFLKSSGLFDDLKIRAGWGLTGNQEIPSKITQALFTSTLSATSSYPLDGTKNYPAGTTYARLANPDIQWEVSQQIDLGVDFSLIKGSLSGSVDYFNKVSKDILLEVIPADPVQPAGTIWTNVKDMEIVNKGLELELLFRKSINKNFKFELGGNVTFIDNMVKNSPYTVIPSGSASGSGLTSATINGYLNNQPIGTFFLKEFIGFDEKGISKFTDITGDGNVSDNDRIAAGTALPNKIFNLNGNISFRGFDLNANFNGVSGNKVYDNTANANFYKLRLSKSINTTAEAIAFPEESINNSAPISTRYLKDGGFFRLNNLSLGYNFNTKKLGIQSFIPNMRLSVTGQNLFVITKYDGFDPDVNTDRAINGVLSYGIDYLTYPKAKSFLVGLTIGL